MKAKKVFYYVTLTVLIGVFAFSAYKLTDYWIAKVRSERMMEAASQFVGVTTENEEGSENLVITGDPESMVIDFESLWKINEDIVAWIYCPDTRINYPIVQGSDNSYYLYRLLDGTWNVNGTIFMDYRNNSNFTDGNTLIYGHRMKTGAMFAELINYNRQSFYDEHPCMYIYTPDQTYRMDLFAACVVDSIGDIYGLNPSDDVIRSCIEKSTFIADLSWPTGNVVTLSTCTYEYEDARYVVLGDLVPIG